jgi:hypothetical protein
VLTPFNAPVITVNAMNDGARYSKDVGTLGINGMFVMLIG